VACAGAVGRKDGGREGTEEGKPAFCRWVQRALKSCRAALLFTLFVILYSPCEGCG
jgi:hypothetical protein